MQALEGTWGHLDRGALCLWYAEHGSEGEICEPGGLILMDPMDSCPTERGTTGKEPEKGSLMPGSQGNNSVA